MPGFFREFVTDDEGVVAVIFALTLLPALGLVGAAVDYTRGANIRDHMQKSVDAAAIAAALDKGKDPAPILAMAKHQITGKFGDQVSAVTVDGSWVTSTDYQVTATATMQNYIVKVVPGVPDTMDLGTQALARVINGSVAKNPKMLQLDPEAGDYNQIYAYCFKPSGNGLGSNNGGGNSSKGRGSGEGRSQMTLIADNAGSSFTFTMPVCEEGEMLSWRLRNVRNARQTPSMWNNSTTEQYDYYSDTTRSGGGNGGAEKYNFEDGLPILETTVCKTLAECKPKSQGGVIPEGKNRNPNAASKACDPKKGEYMYYGWEDRPPGRGWTDSDYDDIRIVIECPDPQLFKQVRLVG